MPSRSWAALIYNVFFNPTGVTCDMKNDDCHIPLLESVFEAFPNIPINVDIKTNSDVLIDNVSSIVVNFYFFLTASFLVH